MVSEEAIKEIISSYSTPTYVYDLDEFTSVVANAARTLQDTASLCFAMKCNPFLVKKAADLVDRIEVCSFGEYMICRDAKIPAEKLLISGVLKKPSDIQQILRETEGKSIYTVESADHLRLMAAWALENKAPIRILIRLTSGNQFGVEEEELLRMVKAIQSSYVKFLGVHYYSGTMKKKATRVDKELAKLDALLVKIEEECGIKVPELEYGPGIPAEYFTEIEMPSAQEFLDEIVKVVPTMNWKGQVTIELGRGLAATVGAYITKVYDQKCNKGINYAIVDGGIHQLNYDGQIRGMYHPYIDVYHDMDEDFMNREDFLPMIETPLITESQNDSENSSVEREDTKSWTICGSLCTVNDVMVANVALENLAVGDYLVFKNTGAYSAMEGMNLFLSHELTDIMLYSKEDGFDIIRSGVESWEMNSPMQNKKIQIYVNSLK